MRLLRLILLLLTLLAAGPASAAVEGLEANGPNPALADRLKLVEVSPLVVGEGGFVFRCEDQGFGAVAMASRVPGGYGAALGRGRPLGLCAILLGGDDL